MREQVSDKCLLDWMEGCCVVVSSWPLSGGRRNYHVMVGRDYYEATTLREALAAARLAQLAEKRRREKGGE